MSPVSRDYVAINSSIEGLKWSAIAGVDGSVDIARSSSLVDAIKVAVVPSPPAANVALCVGVARFVGWLANAREDEFLVVAIRIIARCF